MKRAKKEKTKITLFKVRNLTGYTLRVEHTEFRREQRGLGVEESEVPGKSWEEAENFLEVENQQEIGFNSKQSIEVFSTSLDSNMKLNVYFEAGRERCFIENIDLGDYSNQRKKWLQPRLSRQRSQR